MRTYTLARHEVSGEETVFPESGGDGQTADLSSNMPIALLPSADLVRKYESLSRSQREDISEKKQVFSTKLAVMRDAKAQLEQALNTVSPLREVEEEPSASAAQAWGMVGVGAVFFSDVVIGEGGPFAGMYTLAGHLIYCVSSVSFVLFSPYGLAAAAICGVICIIDCVVNYAVFGPTLKSIFGISATNTVHSLTSIQLESVKTAREIYLLLNQANTWKDKEEMSCLLPDLASLMEMINQDINNLNKAKKPYTISCFILIKEGSVLLGFAILTGGNAHFLVTGFLSTLAKGTAIATHVPLILLLVIVLLQVVSRLISRIQNVHSLLNPEEKEIKERDKELKNFFLQVRPGTIEQLKNSLEAEKKDSSLVLTSEGNFSPVKTDEGISSEKKVTEEKRFHIDDAEKEISRSPSRTKLTLAGAAEEESSSEVRTGRKPSSLRINSIFSSYPGAGTALTQASLPRTRSALSQGAQPIGDISLWSKKNGSNWSQSEISSRIPQLSCSGGGN